MNAFEDNIQLWHHIRTVFRERPRESLQGLEPLGSLGLNAADFGREGDEVDSLPIDPPPIRSLPVSSLCSVIRGQGPRGRVRVRAKVLKLTSWSRNCKSLSMLVELLAVGRLSQNQVSEGHQRSNQFSWGMLWERHDQLPDVVLGRASSHAFAWHHPRPREMICNDSEVCAQNPIPSEISRDGYCSWDSRPISEYLRIILASQDRQIRWPWLKGWLRLRLAFHTMHWVLAMLKTFFASVPTLPETNQTSWILHLCF